jgi:hypothetical protein
LHGLILVALQLLPEGTGPGTAAAMVAETLVATAERMLAAAVE